MLFKLFVVLFFVFGACFEVGASDRLKVRRRSTTTSTTPAPAEEQPTEEIDNSITAREESLLNREEAFQLRETSFKEREVNLTLREEKLKEREFQITIREDKVSEREKNSGNQRKCGVDVAVKNHDLFQERFDPITMKYYTIGSTEPCGENMRFFAIPEENSNEGKCDCDYHQCSRPLIYSAKYNQCFWAWSQGPCEQGEWIVFNDTLHTVCEPNKCPKSLGIGQPKFYFKDLDDELCYESTTKGYCEMENERLFQTAEDPIPACRTHRTCPIISQPAQQICIPGNRRFSEGSCVVQKY